MNKLIKILRKFANWLDKIGYEMYPNLTKHMNKKNE